MFGYSELLCTDNYVSYNVKVANLFGLDAAILISEYINIQNKAEAKKKLVDIDGEYFFTVDRKYITGRTTFSITDQKSIEDKLKGLQILVKHDTIKDAIRVNIDMLASIVQSPDESFKKAVKQSAKNKNKTKSEVTGEAILKSLTKSIKTDNVELKECYIEWLKTIQGKYGFINKETLLMAQNTVDKYCNHDLDKALNVVKTATALAYKDMNWAISAIAKNQKTAIEYSHLNKILSTTGLSEEDF